MITTCTQHNHPWTGQRSSSYAWNWLTSLIYFLNSSSITTDAWSSSYHSFSELYVYTEGDDVQRPELISLLSSTLGLFTSRSWTLVRKVSSCVSFPWFDDVICPPLRLKNDENKDTKTWKKHWFEKKKFVREGAVEISIHCLTLFPYYLISLPYITYR